MFYHSSEPIVTGNCKIPPSYLCFSLEERLDPSFCSLSGRYCWGWGPPTRGPQHRETRKSAAPVRKGNLVRVRQPSLEAEKWRLRVNFNMGRGNNARPSFVGMLIVGEVRPIWKLRWASWEPFERANLFQDERKAFSYWMDGGCPGGLRHWLANEPRGKEEASKQLVSSVEPKVKAKVSRFWRVSAPTGS